MQYRSFGISGTVIVAPLCIDAPHRVERVPVHANDRSVCPAAWASGNGTADLRPLPACYAVEHPVGLGADVGFRCD